VRSGKLPLGEPASVIRLGGSPRKRAVLVEMDEQLPDHNNNGMAHSS